MERSLLETKITLPELVLDKKIVEGNKIVQLAQAEDQKKVSVVGLSEKIFKLIDDQGYVIHLVLPRGRIRISDAKYVVRAMAIENIEELNENTKLKWDRHPRSEGTLDPEEIRSSWSNAFAYREEDPSSNIKGLRTPQIGALHAVSAHWSVSNATATVVMPTGTGKTEVMLSILVSKGCEKLLVVVPTEPLRQQTHLKFRSLGVLQNIGVLDENVALPRVAYINHGVKDERSAQAILDNTNVIVATPNALNGFTDDALARLGSGCSHLFIDEAHHAPAPMWNRIKELFVEKPVLQFTATPYRNDGKKLEGEIIYNYPLGLAQDNGYFKPIHLIKISEFDDNKADKEIAKRAVKLLDEELGAGKDHIIMARAQRITRAERLFDIYQEVGADYRPTLVHNKLSETEKREIYQRLRRRDTRLIVCVNMLGEGFDLPSLKIAAIHDVHKNLATTLQFVGRFTRTASDDIGDATVVVNSAEPGVDEKIATLYAEDPDWNKILRQESESTIKREKDLHQVVDDFHGELSDQVSLWNLRPAFSAFTYSTNAQRWSPRRFEEIMRPTDKYWSAISHDRKQLICVFTREDEVKWGQYKDIKNLAFELFIAYWDDSNQTLFIHCSDYDAINCDRLANLLCGANTEVKTGPVLFNLFAGINHPMVRNLGAAKAGTISFTMFFGSEVTRGLTEIEKAESAPNNIFGWGYENGDRVTYGCSAKSGKLWSQGGGSILDWTEWCDRVQEKLEEPNEDELEIIKGFLKPRPLNGRYPSVAVGVEWGERLMTAPENRISFFFGSTEVPMFDVGLEIIKHSEEGPIHIHLSSEVAASEYRITYHEASERDGAADGACTCERVNGPPVKIQKYGRPEVALEEYLEKDPVIIRYADGSFSYGNYHVLTPDPDTFYDRESLEPIEWTVDIQAESEGPERNSNTIQNQVIESIKDEYEIVINDDGSYEAADVVAIRRDSDNAYTLHLIHCKYSKTEEPGGDISNMYELCGQAQKSIRWKHAGLDYLIDHIKVREQRWRERGHSRFVKGDMAELLAIKKFARYAEMRFAVSIYQPGLSKAGVSTDITQLLGSTENYLVKTSEASFKVYCSP